MNEIDKQKLLEEENAMDFSSIQVIAYQLLKENEEIKKRVQAQIQYVMIDEYQDTNFVQEQLIFLIAEQHHNLCVVGDDDQGLYRFRGATIRNILEFPSKWEHCEQISLVDNYRSERDIVAFYTVFLKRCAVVYLVCKSFARIILKVFQDKFFLLVLGSQIQLHIAS